MGKEDLDGHGVPKSLGDFGLGMACGGDVNIFATVDLKKSIVDGIDQALCNGLYLQYFAQCRGSMDGVWVLLHAAADLAVWNVTIRNVLFRSVPMCQED